MSEKTYENIKIETLPESRVKITGEINKAAFEKATKQATDQIKSTVEIPGFRAGKAPENLVIKHVGEMKILEKAAEAAINEVYGEILREHNVRAIGAPFVSITKIAVGNPLGFIIETAVMPEIKLENYKKLAESAKAEIPETPGTVEEKEVESVIEDLRKRVGFDFDVESETVTEAAAESEIGTGTEPKAETTNKETSDKKKEKKLPELNEEFVKKFGDFPSVEAFKEKIKENILENKKQETKDKRRAAIADKLIAESKFDVPEVIVDSELETMINQFRADVERNGLTFDGYLKQVKKTEEDIRKEWRESALRRARLELILKYIARTEKITPPEEDIKKEVDHIVSHHKKADRFQVRMYVENLMTNKLTFEFLEK